MKTNKVRITLDFVYETKASLDSVPHDLSTVALMACQGYPGVAKALKKRGVVAMLPGALHSVALDFRKKKTGRKP